MKTLAAASVMLALGSSALAASHAGETEFRAIYKELVETNTSLSEGDCTLAAQRLAAHLEVAFERVEPSPEPDSPVVLPPGLRVELPAELQGRLAVAAELHSTTALKACLHPLRQHGPEGRLLADAIRQLMRSYDMDGIQLLLARTLQPRRLTAGVTAHAAGAT